MGNTITGAGIGRQAVPAEGGVTPAIQQWAGFYEQSLGLSPVRLHARTKKLVLDGPVRSSPFTDFRPDDNISLQSINGLVVLDDDIIKRGPEWARIDETFLPDTPAKWGRISAPRSKRLYLCPTLNVAQTWQDLTNDHLLQLRVGVHDMCPPSLHPDTGERLRWCGPLWRDMLTPIEASLLIHQCNLRASAVLIALDWPAHGRRRLALAYSRFLLETLGLSVDETARVLMTAAFLGNSTDDGVRSIHRKVLDTKDALEKKAKAIGATYIRHTLQPEGKGAALLHRLREWFGKTSEVEEAVEALNEKHAFVWMQSGFPIILAEDTLDGRPHQRFSKPSDMPLLYPRPVGVGAKKNGDKIYKPVGSVWLTHPNRRFYRGIELAPHGRGNPGFYNLWRGFSVEPKKGDYPRFTEHLMLVAGNNADHAKYIKTWMADTVQHPERPVGIALAFRGQQGTGKSTFAIWFGELFGPHFLHLDSEQHLLGRFNSHLHNIILLLADEAVWAGSKAGLGALKRMITEKTLNVEKKRVDIITVKNLLHMIVCSNEKWVVPVGFDNRRFAIFGTSAARREDKAFFAAVHDELSNRGGLSALLYDLLEFKSDIQLHDIPETGDLLEQKSLSADDEEAWWLEKLHQGFLEISTTSDGDTQYTWPASIRKDMQHNDYCAFLDKHHKGFRKSRATETQLGIFITNRTPLKDGGQTLFDDGRKRVWEVPSLEDCRAHWARTNRWPADHLWHYGRCRTCGELLCGEH
jgi:hypothetical protein